jgi:diguanylate cyclase (GGDEF)-like protein
VSTNVVALHLAHGSSRASDADVLRRTLDEALATLAHVLTAGDTGSPEVVAAVDRCRADLAAGLEVDAIAARARTCFESTRKSAAQAKSRTAEQRSQVSSLVAMVRETVAAVAGDHATIDKTLTGSAERFQRLAGVQDIRQIQAQLVEEVSTLKRVTIERRAAWDKTREEFGTRLTTLESQLDHTRREAAVDPLTNVANRRTFERTCREWLGPNRPGFVMAMTDVDDFKQINDQHGHAVGDKVLVAVAESLSRSMRAGDVVARLGGDEFAIIAVGLTLRQAEGRFAGIGRAAQKACEALIPNGTLPSISIGLAECSAGDTLESLQERADTALYQAKKSGKGRVAVKASPLLRDLRK